MNWFSDVPMDPCGYKIVLDKKVTTEYINKDWQFKLSKEKLTGNETIYFAYACSSNSEYRWEQAKIRRTLN